MTSKIEVNSVIVSECSRVVACQILRDYFLRVRAGAGGVLTPAIVPALETWSSVSTTTFNFAVRR